MEPFTKFGWRGIEITVPASWELAAHHGSQKAGYACLDDGRDMRLQVRWSRSKGDLADLEGVLRRYQRSLTKACKGNLKFDLESAAPLAIRGRAERVAVSFFWQSDREAYGMAWHCRVCGRVVIVEILFPVGESDRSLARRIMGSLADHRDDGRVLWSLYDFSFSVPSTYSLDHPDLVPGRLRFAFKSARRAWLRIERWAIASQWMDKVTLEAWPAELLKLMRISNRGPLVQTETQIRQHRAVRFAVPVSGGGFLRRERVTGLVWHALEEDKAFVVMEAGGADGLTQEVADTVRSS
jgi:hypothetical protein